MDPLLADLRKGPFDNEPRFYPPGQHPATLRLRTQIERLEQIVEKHGPWPELVGHIAYMRDELAIFEEGESETKARTLHLLEKANRKENE